MNLPLTELVPQILLVREPRDGQNVQLGTHLGHEPLVEPFVVEELRVGDRVEFIGLVLPDVVAGRALRVVGRAGRVVADGLREVGRIVVALRLTVACAGRHVEPAVERMERGVDASGQVLARVLDGDTLVLVVLERGIDRSHTGVGLKVDGMFVREIALVEHRVVPVEVRAVVDGSLLGTQLQILGAGQHVGTLHHLLVGNFARVGEPHGALLQPAGALRRDEDHTARGAGSVDGARRSVLQHVDRLDVLGQNRADIAAGHAVDHHQRTLTRIDRRDAAQLESVAGVGRIGAGDHQAADLAAQGVGHARTADAGHQIIARNGRNGAGHHLFVQRTVADHDDLIHHRLGLRHLDVDLRPGTHRFTLGLVAYERKKQRGIARCGNGITAVRTGDGTVLRALDDDGHSGEGKILLVDDFTGDCSRPPPCANEIALIFSAIKHKNSCKDFIIDLD